MSSNKRIVIRYKMFEFGYPYNPKKDVKHFNDYIKDVIDKFNVCKIIIFNSLSEELKWSRNAIKNPNLYNIGDLYG